MKHINPEQLFAYSQSAALSSTIVVPCYNEEKRLNVISFQNFLTWNPNIRLIFVNDGSSDNTSQVLRNIRELTPSRVDIIELEENSGKAEAVRQGLLYAAKQGVQYVGYWDADLATPLDAIEDLLRIFNKMPDIEIVYGTRKTMLGHKINRDWKRRIVSRSCASLARFAIGLPVTDTQCGAKIFKNSEQLRQSLEKKFNTGWLFDIELLTRLIRLHEEPKSKLYEYPLSEWREIPGSKIDFKTIVKSGFIMLDLIAKTRFMRSPAMPC